MGPKQEAHTTERAWRRVIGGAATEYQEVPL